MPKLSSNVPTGTIGLVFAIMFCLGVAVSLGGFLGTPVFGSLLVAGVLGFVGLIVSVIGIATGSGRIAGTCGLLVGLLGCITACVGFQTKFPGAPFAAIAN